MGWKYAITLIQERDASECNARIHICVRDVNRKITIPLHVKRTLRLLQLVVLQLQLQTKTRNLIND